jgi:hypothetical protein
VTGDVSTCNDNDLQTVARECGTAACTTFPELAAVVAAWATLPEAVRARIVGLVEGATATADGRGPTIVGFPGGP